MSRRAVPATPHQAIAAAARQMVNEELQHRGFRYGSRQTLAIANLEPADTTPQLMPKLFGGHFPT